MVELDGYDLGRVRAARGRKMSDVLLSVYEQVERPRVNLGGGGPPGRAD